MKKIALLTVIAWMMPMILFSQTYASLWKQVREAEKNDLPQTEQEVLSKIVKKAEKEKAYGQLLSAELLSAKCAAQVAPDSLLPAVERLQQREQQAKSEPLKAVYCTVLGYIYANERGMGDEAPARSAYYYERALLHPEQLATVKAADYEPFVVTGSDSRYFNNDLLSIIGYETKRYDVLLSYYERTGNRRAAMLTALEQLRQERLEAQVAYNKATYLQRIDSLINLYGDLTEAGELAIERYEYMSQYTDATAEQRYQYINVALDRWGAWPRMNSLRNSLRSLTAQQFQLRMDHEVIIPGQAQTVRLDNLRGIGQLTVRLYRVKAQGDISYRPGSNDGYKKIKPLLTLLSEYTQTRQYVGKRPFELYEDSLLLPALPVGVYMIEAESTPATSVARSLLFVSDVRLLSQHLPGNTIRYVVVNATTGQPLREASIRITTHDYASGRSVKNVATLTTNADGEATHKYTRNRPQELFATTKDDVYCPPTDGYGNFSYYNNKQKVRSAAIYTDRQIYRPGQTVHAAAIFYETVNGFEHAVQANRQLTITLRDANYQLIGERQVVTDAFGTCAADFTLPSQGLSGTMTLEVDGKYHHIRVEEYKRPTFEVQFPEVKENYADGDTLLVRATAKSYAGVPVQGAKVRYKVVRRRAFWWFSYSNYWKEGYIGSSSDDEEVFAAEVITDADGAFTVEMPMVLPKTRYTMFYNFIVTADVTDQAGETRQGQLSLPLGNRKTALMLDLPEKILAERPQQGVFHLRNAAGNDVDANLKWRLDGGSWQQLKSNVPFSVADAKLKSGKHTIEAICEGDTLEQSFVLFSLADKRPATTTKDWYYQSNSQFANDGTPVTVQVGSSDKNVHVVYSIISGDNVLESGSFNLSDELNNRKFNYQDSYGNGLLLTYAWVKDGVVYSHTGQIRRPLPDKRLTMKWKTFRNRLTPGQQEEWIMTITKPDGTPADKAQLLAVLYDKSLDQLVKQEWSLNPYIYLPLPGTNWRFAQWSELSGSGFKQQGWLRIDDLDFSHFDHDVYPVYVYHTFNSWAGSRIKVRGAHKLMARANMDVAMDEMAMAKESVSLTAAPPMAGMASGAAAEEEKAVMEPAEELTEVQPRENLSETAFFYPQLTTDDNGEAAIRFTLPESLTTWRFIGIAHTTDLMNGLLDDEAVAKKDVMIQPNMPRFVRMGDKATLMARIFNTGETTAVGTARLQLIDPETEKVVSEQRCRISVDAGQTASVNFDYAPDDRYSLLIARFSVSGSNFSDGEQHYLPVLPNAERVTVTVPFTQNEPGVKTIQLDKLFPKTALEGNSLSPVLSSVSAQKTLTIEYTNNPAWLMIQTLPSMATPSDENAVSQAASLYANTIGQHLLKQNPQAKGVFEQWKRESAGQATSLQSALQTNQELKDLVLNETPWVLEANAEAEQKQRLADFFDANLMTMRLNSATEKLTKLQNGDGSWSWWKGMQGSVYMTVAVSELLVRLNEMAGKQESTETMLSSAFSYLGKEFVKEVDEMKRQEKKGHKQTFPSFNALQWLYICTLDGRQLPSDVQQANAYLKNLLKKERKNQSLYEKAMSAIVLNAPLYVKSLKEYTVYKEEMGRYYDAPRASYSWRDYRIPTQVAAIEAIKRLTPDDTKTVEEMQRWLLQEKRTQAWDTPLNSIDAVYAFLNGNNQVLAPQEKTALKVDGQPLATPQATAGIGYVKTTLPAKKQRVFTAEKNSTGTSWGAVYAQFMQPTHDIDDQKSGISIKREFLADGKSLGKNPTLKVGQRITVRLTIQSERDLDFIQIVDRRAACMEPVQQLSGYRFAAYCTPKDNATHYYYDWFSKGKHVLETEYYIDRPGRYETGSCTVQCAYSPEFRGNTSSITITVEE